MKDEGKPALSSFHPSSLIPHPFLPAPVLLNTWKHHAGALRGHIRQAVAAGPAGLEALAGRLAVVGTDLMDLYLGDLSPGRIGELLLDRLRAAGHFEFSAYRDWIDEG